MKVLLTYREETEEIIRYNEIIKSIDEVTLKNLEEAEEAYIGLDIVRKAHDGALAFGILANKVNDYKIALNGDEAPFFMEEAIQSFNDFEVSDVVNRIRLLNKMRKYYNPDNPNNGKSILKIWLTHSAEIIFEFYGSKVELEAIINNIELFRLPKADEFDYELQEYGYNYKLFIRNWWD